MEKVSCAIRIVQALEVRGLKPADLCKMTGINKSTVSQYINGVYDPSQIRTELIARALHVNEAWLMGYDVPMDREKPTTVSDDGLVEIAEIFKQLSYENRAKLLELCHLYLDAQNNSKGN